MIASHQFIWVRQSFNWLDMFSLHNRTGWNVEPIPRNNLRITKQMRGNESIRWACLLITDSAIRRYSGYKYPSYLMMLSCSYSKFRASRRLFRLLLERRSDHCCYTQGSLWLMVGCCCLRYTSKRMAEINAGSCLYEAAFHQEVGTM